MGHLSASGSLRRRASRRRTRSKPLASRALLTAPQALHDELRLGLRHKLHREAATGRGHLPADAHDSFPDQRLPARILDDELGAAASEIRAVPCHVEKQPSDLAEHGALERLDRWRGHPPTTPVTRQEIVYRPAALHNPGQRLLVAECPCAALRKHYRRRRKPMTPGVARPPHPHVFPELAGICQEFLGQHCPERPATSIACSVSADENVGGLVDIWRLIEDRERRGNNFATTDGHLGPLEPCASIGRPPVGDDSARLPPPEKQSSREAHPGASDECHHRCERRILTQVPRPGKWPFDE